MIVEEKTLLSTISRFCLLTRYGFCLFMDMKQIVLPGTFASLVGAITLILLVSVVYSCRQGGHPHDMGNKPNGSSHANSTVVESPQHGVAKTSASSSAERLPSQTM